MKKIASALLAAIMLLVCLAVPAFADAQPGYVTDDAGILTDSELSELEARAEQVSTQYDCGVYIVTVDDFAEYGSVSDIESFGKGLFADYELGLGSDGCGIVLILSMAERDYALVAHGDLANTAFTDYGKDALAELFLDDFRSDDWYWGFSDYIDGCEEYLRAALYDEPVDVPGSGYDYGSDYDGYYDYGGSDLGFFWRLTHTTSPYTLALIIVFSAIIALSVCLIMRRMMKTAVSAANANRYVVGGIVLSHSNDYFTHTTVTRTQVESDDDNSSHGGTSVDSGGYSSSSGKF